MYASTINTAKYCSFPDVTYIQERIKFAILFYAYRIFKSHSESSQAAFTRVAP